MEIILLEQVVNLGRLGDLVNVKEGYARNYLIPQGKAQRATKENLAEFEQKCEKPCSLDRHRQLSLKTRTSSRYPSRDDFSIFGNEIFQNISIFIINPLYLLSRKTTKFTSFK